MIKDTNNESTIIEWEIDSADNNIIDYQPILTYGKKEITND